jgi:DNA-binding transcriptional MerR regulator
MRSGELAKLASISTDTLRHYERLGLLPAPIRTRGNYREYLPQAIDRVRLIRNALAIGFSLKEVARILKVREQGGAPCREVRELAQQKLVELARHIEELTLYRDNLQKMLVDWDERLRKTGRSGRASLLEVLAEPPTRPSLGLKSRRQA